MDRFKILNIVLAVISWTITLSVWLYWEYICIQGGCTWDLRNYALRPILWGFCSLAIILSSLTIFPSKLFKHWLVHVASWSVLLSLYFVILEDPNDSGVLAFGRGLLSWVFGTMIFILTAIYAISWHLYFWKKGSVQKRDLLKLLWLIVPALLFNFGWQLF